MERSILISDEEGGCVSRLEVCDAQGDRLIVDAVDRRPDDGVGRPPVRLEVTLGAVEDDECVDLDPLSARALSDFFDRWLQEVGA